VTETDARRIEGLDALLRPRSVAVVGASRNPSGIGHRILSALVRDGFQGPVYPVNPNAPHVASIAAYPSIEAIGATVDLAVIAVPDGAVPEALESCIRAGVRGIVLITAGFAETGEEGRTRQDALVARLREAGIRMVGPNCLGLIHTHPDIRLNASFAPAMPPRGTIALGSQSGALGIAIIALARALGLGLSAFVSLGNKADVSGNDLLEYWENDPDTRVVLLYLESFGNPGRFARVARRVGRNKPIVVVKAGRSESGGRAASSHTAALAAPDAAVQALVRQAGILRADTLGEMFDVARILADQPLPPGRRVAVVTNAGGPAILCADALEGSDMVVEPLSPETRRELASFLPSNAAVANPVDMIAAAGPDAFRRSVKVLLGAEEVDTVVVLYTPVGLFTVDEIGRAIALGVAEGRRNVGTRKPVLAAFVGPEEEVHALAVPETGETIPCFRFPEEIGRALGKVTGHAEWRESDLGSFPAFPDADLATARAICRDAIDARGGGWLTVQEARTVLESVGLQTAAGGVATSAEEAVSLAAQVGYPVALKLASTTLVHKTEVGGVRLGLADTEAVRSAFAEMRAGLAAIGQESAMEGVLVQPMLSGTAEILIGARVEKPFGPLIAFGLGGIHVEILRDVSFRVAPMTDRDARELVREIRGIRLLEGYRGHPPADVDAIEEALLRISVLTEAVPEIAELDLNPIFALPPGEGYRIVDARIRVARVPAQGPARGPAHVPARGPAGTGRLEGR